MFKNTHGVNVKNCKLYGCGTYGVTAWESSDIDVKDTEIYECTYGAVSLYETKNADFNNCIFRDCREFSIFEIINCSNVKISDSLIKDNVSDSEWSSFISVSGKNIEFSNCKFEGNKFIKFCDDYVAFNNCEMQ